VDLNAEAGERGFCFGGEVGGISGKNPRRTFKKQNAGLGGSM